MTAIDWNSLQSRWSFPTLVWFGAGRLADLPQALAELGARTPLLVTDRGLVDSAIVKGAREALTGAGIDHAVFADVRPNPTTDDVEAGVAVARAGGHDCVIAVGGGSAMDAAKAIAMMVGQSRPILDFEDIGDNWRRVETAAMLPVVAIPTTAGTGSEFGRSSVITDPAEHRKAIIFHPEMLPDLVILDPLVTVGLPRGLTAATGMDALSHAMEAYCAPGFHPMADGLALTAMRMIRDALPVACATPDNIEARANMLVASAMACTALQKGLGAVHALAHPLGARYDAHHGMLNAVLLPHVVRFNQPAIGPQMKTLAHWLDLPGATPGEAVLTWLESLQQQIGMPATLTAMGVTIDDDDLPALIADALRDPCAGGNPVPLDADKLMEILGEAR